MCEDLAAKWNRATESLSETRLITLLIQTLKKCQTQKLFNLESN